MITTPHIFRGALFLLAVLPMAISHEALAQSESDVILEHKSAMIYTLSTFVTWPKGTFASSSEPIVIGVLGSKPILRELTAVTKGRVIGGRPVKVMSVSLKDDLDKVHILYIDKSLVRDFHTLEKEKYSEAPILTYGESATFDKDGGAMRISLQGSKHTITVNIDAIERKHLRVSTKLLEFAEVVRDKT